MTRIYIDTNVFLDFYQSANDRMGIFHELLERVESIVVPEQTLREFRRNRAARLTQLAGQIEKGANINIHTTAIVQEMPEFKLWMKARDEAKRQVHAIASQLRTWARDEASDPVHQEFVKLYMLGTTMSTPPDALNKAQTRKLLGEPPTSPDKHTVGDEIIWETLLALCNDDLIVVSRDHTFLDNESILRSEFNIQGGRKLVRITDSLGEALKLVGKPSPPIEKAEKEEAQREAAERKALYSARPGMRHRRAVGIGPVACPLTFVIPVRLPPRAVTLGRMSDVTRLLDAAAAGDRQAAAELLPLVYDELRQLAAARMAAEAPGHTLDATALVHEAYLRLTGGASRSRPRSHFFAAAAEAMRRILVDHARAGTADKRGGRRDRVPLDEAATLAPSRPDQLLALDEALDRFAAEEPRKAELVMLRFFGGLSIPEAADALGVSVPTAERWWAFARTWLYAELSTARKFRESVMGFARRFPP